MKKIVHKSAIPLYAAAVVWILYAVLFPLYKPGHFLLAAIAAAVVGLIARALCKDVVEEVPETTGNEELDQMTAEGRRAIEEMKALDERIADEKISAAIVRLQQVTEQIFREVKSEPKKLPQIRKFMSYYLPTTLKLLRAYDSACAQGVSGENIDAAKKGVAGIMDRIVAAFEKQLDSLFGDQALDISTDVTVLENMMVREGFSADSLHQTVQTNTSSSDTEEGEGGITLEL
ncbi:MAG: 5-bromo-4-chloroindolyl phosphate hydrolysis family protein [Oscillospiraceae bacterium]|nr:5-bromo-4-chloroindolyl phosphate hydrolysis family protein [Oscillospiraceae bacterium]